MHYMVELFASNDHDELELQINGWLRAHRPKQVVSTAFVADGAEFTYCIMILYEPKQVPLPRYKQEKYPPK